MFLEPQTSQSIHFLLFTNLSEFDLKSLLKQNSQGTHCEFWQNKAFESHTEDDILKKKKKKKKAQVSQDSYKQAELSQWIIW